MKTIKKIFDISSSKLRNYYFFYILLSILNAIVEILAISSILPLLDILINKSNFFIIKINEITQKYLNFDITDLTPNGKAFTSFQVKVRMRSANQSYPPLIKDLRCIALA